MSNRRIHIITDSTCDIPQSLLDAYSITVQAHVLIWGDLQYRDRVDLLPEEFYTRLQTDPQMPTTSQATPQDFAETYRQVVERGAEEIVVLTVSSGLSGAFQSARLAAENAPVPVHVYDSRGVTMSLGWQVLAAARVCADGGGVQDILAAADRVRRGMHLYIGLDTLEYVYRGGRIGNARRLLGAMLNVKPILLVNHESGVVEPGGMALTRRKGLDLLYNSFFEQLDPSRPMRVAVLHGDAAKEAAALCERVNQDHHPQELITNITCPALGIHTGPRAIAICGYNE